MLIPWEPQKVESQISFNYAIILHLFVCMKKIACLTYIFENQLNTYATYMNVG